LYATIRLSGFILLTQDAFCFFGFGFNFINAFFIIPPLSGFLELQNNDLSGNIPSELASILGLQNILDLSNNKLSGSLPTELGMLVELSKYDALLLMLMLFIKNKHFQDKIIHNSLRRQFTASN
jgi:hypothetical protein